MTATEQTNFGPAAGFPWLRFLVAGGGSLVIFYAAVTLYLINQPLFGAILLALGVGFAIVFGSQKFYSARFIFPGIAAILIFIVFPVIYTVYLGFTNYSSFNLLTYERSIEIIQSAKTIDKSSEVKFSVARDDGSYRIYLPQEGLISQPVALDGPQSASLTPTPKQPNDVLETREAIKLRAGLQVLDLVKPDGSILKNSGLRTFAGITPEYERIDENQLLRVSDGAVLTANHDNGFFESEEGEVVPPGWRVNIGLQNFVRIFTSEGVRGPMVSIFIWTTTFAVLSVGLTFALGLTLAVILQWPHLRFKPMYRLLLILPYAVPSFISILVFKGLFNQNFGEINLILEALFGIRPEWFTNATLARIMIVMVNVWLGYPYMMLLSMGFLQSVPEDHKKAAALEGASALRVFFSITLPQIIPPFLPMLIASFAFNFNNIVLILLMTRGGPDIPGTVIPAGKTDILGSFTYRISFMDSGQQFGLAGAITLLIFLIVGAVAYANFVAMRRVADKRRHGA